MEGNNLDKIHQILLRKKKKYKILSVFFRTKARIVKFLPLQNIHFPFLTKTILADPEKELQIFLPRETGAPEYSVGVTRPAVCALCLRDVFIPGNSSFFLTKQKDTIFYEVYPTDPPVNFIYNHTNISFHSNSLAKITNHPTKFHRLDAVYLGGTFSFNYYHFVIELLSKTQFITKIPDYRKLTFILDEDIQKIPNLKTLAEFFLKDLKIIYLEKNFYHGFLKLWFITSPNPTVPNLQQGLRFEPDFTMIDPQSVQYLRDVCLQNYKVEEVKVKPVSKIFIARKSARRKYNEEELLCIAVDYGFQAVYFEDLNIHEQIFLMQNADLVVGSSGAAWTNLIFAKRGGKGLTWLGSVWGSFSVFSTLAKSVGFDLKYIRFESKSAEFHEDYEVDSNVFKDHLSSLLKTGISN
ncbi:glycosyltransferase family 61 protein [Kaistella palustris]|uniref:glycosyltransferase family 61 protein n=1 Tax=Kaistella palustris TaxID=493376 RepID=UPI000429F8F4|nr:glycosyltransferase family 61 protein [Kaistella palustris]